jgi:hypothetical protein
MTLRPRHRERGLLAHQGSSARAELGAVDVGGLRVAYRRAGEGQPLVLLHGWPSDSREWRRQLDGLSDEFTVAAWDAPGAGRSSDPPETFRLRHWADRLAGFIQVLGLAPARAAGLSWGGGAWRSSSTLGTPRSSGRCSPCRPPRAGPVPTARRRSRSGSSLWPETPNSRPRSGRRH